MCSLTTAAPSNPMIPMTGMRTGMPVGWTDGRIHGTSTSGGNVMSISSTTLRAPTVRLSVSMARSAALCPTNHRR